MANNMVLTYLHFRILEFPLNNDRGFTPTLVGYPHHTLIRGICVLEDRLGSAKAKLMKTFEIECRRSMIQHDLRNDLKKLVMFNANPGLINYGLLIRGVPSHLLIQGWHYFCFVLERSYGFFRSPMFHVDDVQQLSGCQTQFLLMSGTLGANAKLYETLQERLQGTAGKWILYSRDVAMLIDPKRELRELLKFETICFGLSCDSSMTISSYLVAILCLQLASISYPFWVRRAWLEQPKRSFTFFGPLPKGTGPTVRLQHPFWCQFPWRERWGAVPLQYHVSITCWPFTVNIALESVAVEHQERSGRPLRVVSSKQRPVPLHFSYSQTLCSSGFEPVLIAMSQRWVAMISPLTI